MVSKEAFDDSLYDMNSRPLGITVDKIARWAGVAGKQNDNGIAITPDGKIRTADGKSVDLDEATMQVRDAWDATFVSNVSTDVFGGYVERVFDDHVIVRDGDMLYRYSYTRGDDGAIEFGEAEQVEMVYQPVSGGKSLAIKTLSETETGVTVGGYLLLWGDRKHRDLQNDYFTKSTELWLDRYPTVPTLFHHGLDQDVGMTVMGKRTSYKADDIGIWVEAWLDKSSKYWSMVKPLLYAEALFYSPGSAPHLVKRENDGQLKSFPIVEDTMTPVPAQHRLLPIEQIESAFKSANIELDMPKAKAEVAKTDEDTDSAGAECLQSAMADAEVVAILTKIRQMED